MQAVCDALSRGCGSLCGAMDVAGKAGEGLHAVDVGGHQAMGLLATLAEMLCNPVHFVTSRPLGLYVAITIVAMVAEAYYSVMGLMSPRLHACGIVFTGIAALDIGFAAMHILFAWYCSNAVMARPRGDPLLGAGQSAASISDEVLAHTTSLLAHDKLFAFYFMSWACCLVINMIVFTQLDKCRGTDFGSTITGLMLFQIIFGLIYGSLWYMLLTCGCTSCCSCLFVFKSPAPAVAPQAHVAAPYVGAMPKPSAPPLV